MSMPLPLRSVVLGRTTVIVAFFTCALAGCDSGSARHDLSGRVSFNGKPVPAGKIYFIPDVRQQNSGPQGYADIKDGFYDTRKSGQRSVSGPVTVRIEGQDGHTALFVGYEVAFELSPDSTTKDFEVPSSAADTLPRDPGPAP
jgi:hypothetical protein